MSMVECGETLHRIISGETFCFMEKLIFGLWQIFSQVNGNPEIGNYGIRFAIGIFFSIFLMAILQLRAKLSYDRKHLVAFIGANLLLFRYTLMMGFEWGWQINLYTDWIVHFLFPPLEHFFYMMALGCFGYYSLNAYGYYPGVLKRILVYIPIGISLFFVYATVSWKMFFLKKLPEVTPYMMINADWQSHLIIALAAGYCVVIAIKQYKKYFCFLSAFWTLTFIEHFCRSVAFYNQWEPAEVATIFHAMALWSIPLLILHFTNAYVLRIGEPRERRRPPWEPPCPDCVQPDNRDEVRTTMT